MPSIEQKIQSYLNFSKNKATKSIETENESIKDLDEAESIFKNSNHELKTNPLK